MRPPFATIGAARTPWAGYPRSMLWILVLWSCSGAPPAPADPAEEAPVPVLPAAASVYSEGLWAQRALTVKAGLDEAMRLWRAGDKEGAKAEVDAVRRGSFLPELEPLIRRDVDPRLATELEYRFGLVREAMGRPSEVALQETLDKLTARLDEGAAMLDQKRSVMR